MEQTNTKRTAVTIAVFVATFMAAIEGTIVSTAMPTIVSSLNGIELMNWIFSIYLLTSAVTVPIYGKLSDLFGRKKNIYHCNRYFHHRFFALWFRTNNGTVNYF
ncbi:EmrB/QacA family drug resistance transporter [Listeria riparia FSL S10-1204]|uniref:EmrB/QacA family drug resistance transporter n=1 Tax=Listeria riparia FSL S10-1204 TaxID=1265816 RepID=W7DIW6_9LIST|nr:EmrB/QacA family drug resistance transporter [Listeria riparia FSL S10-1204]